MTTTPPKQRPAPMATKKVPPKKAAKKAAAKAKPPAQPRGKRSKKAQPSLSEVRARERELANKADPHSRAHLKTEFTPDDVAEVCELIRDGKLGLSSACAKLGFRTATFRARMREDSELDKLVNAARADLVDELLDPGEILAIADEATDKDNATAVKVRVWARFELAEKIRPVPKEVNLNHRGQVGVRITGMGELLREISQEGADVGPGPSRPLGG